MTGRFALLIVFGSFRSEPRLLLVRQQENKACSRSNLQAFEEIVKCSAVGISSVSWDSTLHDRIAITDQVISEVPEGILLM